MSSSLCLSLDAGRRLLRVQFVTSPKSNLCTALTVKKETDNDGIDAYAEDSTALKPSVQGDSKRWTQFLTSVLPELYTVCE